MDTQGCLTSRYMVVCIWIWLAGCGSLYLPIWPSQLLAKSEGWVGLSTCQSAGVRTHGTLKPQQPRRSLGLQSTSSSLHLHSLGAGSSGGPQAQHRAVRGCLHGGALLYPFNILHLGPCPPRPAHYAPVPPLHLHKTQNVNLSLHRQKTRHDFKACPTLSD